MVIDQTDPNRALTLDGNAASGILNEIFALEITTSLIEYTGCSREGELGALLALSRLRVLHCPGCGNCILRVVQTPNGFFI